MVVDEDGGAAVEVHPDADGFGEGVAGLEDAGLLAAVDGAAEVFGGLVAWCGSAIPPACPTCC